MRSLAAGMIALAIGICAPATWNAAWADSYPSRPVKIIVPTPAGGPVDAVARVLAHALAPTLGEAVVVDNRAGAGNTIGSKEAALAEPDGYTLLFSSASGLVIAPMLHAQAGYDPINSYAPIALVAEMRANLNLTVAAVSTVFAAIAVVIVVFLDRVAGLDNIIGRGMYRG